MGFYLLQGEVIFDIDGWVLGGMQIGLLVRVLFWGAGAVRPHLLPGCYGACSVLVQVHVFRYLGSMLV